MADRRVASRLAALAHPRTQQPYLHALDTGPDTPGGHPDKGASHRTDHVGPPLLAHYFPAPEPQSRRARRAGHSSRSPWRRAGTCPVGREPSFRGGPVYLVAAATRGLAMSSACAPGLYSGPVRPKGEHVRVRRRRRDPYVVRQAREGRAAGAFVQGLHARATRPWPHTGRGRADHVRVDGRGHDRIPRCGRRRARSPNGVQRRRNRSAARRAAGRT
jgi:hypothetical protein